MNISILIPNHNDLRMKEMIDSIDVWRSEKHEIELLFVLNKPTKELLDQVHSIKMKYSSKFIINVINVGQCNLGLIYNYGIKAALYDNILFIDSDLICGKNAIQKIMDIAERDVDVIKAKVIYEKMNHFVEKARQINTTYSLIPYIPVIMLKRSSLRKLKMDYLFAVDTVWCSDAEFGKRILDDGLSVKYTDAAFYHSYIGIKKDLKDAILYGLGKGIRIKRTHEKINCIRELSEMYAKGKQYNLSIFENMYSLIWIILQQVFCRIQIVLPVLFKDSLPFEESMKIKEVLDEKL